MKTYDLIALGTGSAMNIVEALLQRDPQKKVAVIDKDDPGGICLNRGCIPTKLLVYPAELRRMVEEAGAFGIEAVIKKVHFDRIMERMRSIVGRDVEQIRHSLSHADNIDYYRDTAEFTASYVMRVGKESITAPMIFLCLGSRPLIPGVKGLAKIPFHTSDTILAIDHLPESLIILGGGYIAAEFGHFFSAMGSRVTILGRNPRFLPAEEPEVSELARREMSRHMTILTDHEVIAAKGAPEGMKTITALNRATGKTIRMGAGDILVAGGRASNTDLLHPERAGIRTDEKGWIQVDAYLESSLPKVWALGDANGRHLFKHVANYESRVVYYNVVLKEKVRVDYHAVPHAMFTWPEIASVGLGQREAVAEYGEEGVLVGFHRFENTAKGEAMGLQGFFVKVLVEATGRKILGAHIIGPQASLLIQEIITLMYTEDRSVNPILWGMHIHPALSEVVERAFGSLMPVSEYEALMRDGRL